MSKKKSDTTILWKLILNKLYISEVEEYTLPCPEGKEREQWLACVYMDQEVGGCFIDEINFTEHPLIKNTDIAPDELKNSLKFMIRNELVEDPLQLIRVYEETGATFHLIPIRLTKKGFDVALQNEKERINLVLNSINSYLITAYVFFTLMIAIYYLDQLAIDADAANPIDIFYSYLVALLVIAFVGLPVIWKTLKKLTDSFY